MKNNEKKEKICLMVSEERNGYIVDNFIPTDKNSGNWVFKKNELGQLLKTVEEILLRKDVVKGKDI